MGKEIYLLYTPRSTDRQGLVKLVAHRGVIRHTPMSLFTHMGNGRLFSSRDSGALLSCYGPGPVAVRDTSAPSCSTEKSLSPPGGGTLSTAQLARLTVDSDDSRSGLQEPLPAPVTLHLFPDDLCSSPSFFCSAPQVPLSTSHIPIRSHH